MDELMAGRWIVGAGSDCAGRSQLTRNHLRSDNPEVDSCSMRALAFLWPGENFCPNFCPSELPELILGDLRRRNNADKHVI
jgi:hypothetical protein